MRLSLTALSTCALLLSALPALAEESASPPAETLRLQRLHGLAELWGEVRYRHPTLASQELDWDAALLAALPRVEAARSREDYARALQQMLDTVGDPATRVEPWDSSQPQARPARNPRPLHAWEKEVLVVNLTAAASPPALSSFAPAYAPLVADLQRARAVVVDMRARALTDERGPYRMANALDLIAPQLFQGELRTPAQRMVRRDGYRSQVGIPVGYGIAFTEFSEDIVTGKASPGPRPLVFLFDTGTVVPAVALALQQRGLARILSEGELGQGSGAERLEVKLGEGLTAWVRVSEFTVPLRADERLAERPAADASDAALQKALELARRGWKVPTRIPRPEPLPRALWKPDKRYEESAYPNRALRQLAAIRAWNVIRLFHPTLRLFAHDWQGALVHFLPKFEAARDAREYVLAVAELSTWVEDGHVFLRDHPELTRLWGDWVAPLNVFDINGKMVVVEIEVPSAAPGLRVGDVVEAIDGEPIATRVQRLTPYVTASTPSHRAFKVLRRALGGPVDTTSTLTVRGADGQARQVTISRSRDNLGKEYTENGPAFRVLPGNVGLVRLGLLRAAEVPAMFEQLKGTRALVLDLRGYPQGLWGMAPYLNTRKATDANLALWNVVEGASQAMSFQMRSPVTRGDVPLYQGRTVTLIDERTISQAESVALLLEAVNGTTFVGSPSAGANGDITDFSLPGGINFLFSGAEIRHLDGAQLQCLGVQPHLRVRPTLQGLRAGRDEVLEAALRLLEAPAPSSAPR
ncbi:S41 family peptidase [Hyalangium versicolor]|uniref:S41 family peptidase n=1 Tax=Hyalangium versicolor TaxID=2861190 RepID=UPI001CC91E2C|nr:S41 family peptidase [Hyalangium versicolor]